MFENIDITTPEGLQAACIVFKDSLVSDDENIHVIKNLLNQLSTTLPKIKQVDTAIDAVNGLPDIVEQLETNIFKLDINDSNQQDIATLSEILSQVNNILLAIKSIPARYVSEYTGKALAVEFMKKKFDLKIDYYSVRLMQLQAMTSTWHSIFMGLNEHREDEMHSPIEIYMAGKDKIKPPDQANLDNDIKGNIYTIKVFQIFLTFQLQNLDHLSGPYHMVAFELSEMHADLMRVREQCKIKLDAYNNKSALKKLAHKGASDKDLQPIIDDIDRYFELYNNANLPTDDKGTLLIPEKNKRASIDSVKDRTDAQAQSEEQPDSHDAGNALLEARIENIVQARAKREQTINYLQEELEALQKQDEDNKKKAEEEHPKGDPNNVVELPGAAVKRRRRRFGTEPEKADANNTSTMGAWSDNPSTHAPKPLPADFLDTNIDDERDVPEADKTVTADAKAARTPPVSLEKSRAAMRMDAEPSVIPQVENRTNRDSKIRVGPQKPASGMSTPTKAAAAMFVLGVAGLSVAAVLTGGVAAAFAIGALYISVPSVAAVPITTAGVYFGVRQYSSNNRKDVRALPAPKA